MNRHEKYRKRRDPKRNIALLEIPFGETMEQICCPACGKIYRLGEPVVSACPHYIFCYVGDFGSFEYIKPSLGFTESDLAADSEKSAEAEDADLKNPMEVLIEKYDAPSLLCVGITTGGMACGPSWCTVYYAFDFSPAAE